MLIDYSSRPPLDELTIAAPHLANYRRVYAASEAQVSEARGEEGLAEYLATYERLGARRVVLKARDLETTFGTRIRNEAVAEFCAAHGERYMGFAGVDPHKGMVAVRELEHAVRTLGLCGLNLQCFEHRLAINDKRMYPLYAKAIELDVPVNIHCGTNFSTASLMEYGHPLALDEVMTHFPELRVCASPPGWPWVQELLGVAWRHPNLYIGIVAIRPKLLDVADSGYEPLKRYGLGPLKDRIIFGSGFPMMPVERSLAEIDALNLPPDIKRRWLYANAAAFLGLEEQP